MEQTVDFTHKTCKPCEGGVPPLSDREADEALKSLRGWRREGGWIEKEYEFPDFMGAMNFANRIAQLAEEEGHHPDLHVSWGLLKASLSTHAARGLTENDFILAAKIDEIGKP